jgi:hypothetical protein
VRRPANRLCTNCNMATDALAAVPVNLQARVGDYRESSKIHEAAMGMLASLCKGLGSHRPEVLAVALRKVAGSLDGVEPLGMFDEWANRVLPATESVPKHLLSVEADSTRSKSTDAKMALGNEGEAWQSAASRKSSRFVVSLAEPTFVSGIRFGFASKKTCAASVEVLVDCVRSGKVVRIVPSFPATGFAEVNSLSFGSGVLTTKVVIVLKGHAPKAKGHSLTQLSLGRFVKAPSPASLADTVRAVASALGDASRSTNAELADAALLTLCRLFLATGSAHVGISLFRSMAPIDRLSPGASAATAELLRGLRSSLRRACEMGSPSSSGASGWNSVPAKFKIIHNYARIKDGGMTLYSESSDTYGQVDQAMTKGVYQWEFQLIEDSSGGECSCFGVGTEKPSETSYEYQSSFCLVRCFNGTVYNFGSSDKSINRIHPKDKIKFELDMVKGGNLRCWINNEDQGIIATGLKKHKKLYPTVQYYSSGRSAKILWFKKKGDGASGGGASASVPLAGQEPPKRLKGSLPLGLFDRTGDSMLPLSLNGGEVIVSRGIAVTVKGATNGAGGDPVDAEHWTSGAATQVTWDLGSSSKFHTFEAVLGICDPAFKADRGTKKKPEPAPKEAEEDAAATAAHAAAADSKEAEEDLDIESKEDAPVSSASSASEVFDGPTVTLAVFGNGKELFVSKPFPVTKEAADLPYGHPSLAPQRCSVPISGVSSLSLVVRADGEVAYPLHAVFGNASLIAAPWHAAVSAEVDKPLEELPTSGIGAALKTMEVLQPLVTEALNGSRAITDRTGVVTTPPRLSLPFVADPSNSMMETVTGLVSHLHKVAGTGDETASTCLRFSLQWLGLQLRRMVHASVHPRAIGFLVDLPDAVFGTKSDLEASGSKKKEEEVAAASAAVTAAGSEGSALDVLREAMMALSDDSALPPVVRAAAISVIDDNLQLFYPSKEHRHVLVRDATHGGHQGLVEIQIRWPAPSQGHDEASKGRSVVAGIGAVDSRFERLALLLQSEASHSGFSVRLVSQWRRSMHLILSPVKGEEAAAGEEGPILRLLLGGGFASLLKRAGFTGWSFPEGIPSEGVFCKIERMLEVTDLATSQSKLTQCIVRLFPANVVDDSSASTIITGVKALLRAERSKVTEEEEAASAAAAAAPAPTESAATSAAEGSDSGSGTEGSDGESGSGSEPSEEGSEPSEATGTDDDDEEEEEEEEEDDEDGESTSSSSSSELSE